MSGLVIPIQVVDRLLGGTNLNNFFQNTLTLIAFWLVFQGLAIQGKMSGQRILWWPLIALLLVMTSAFFSIDRSSTTQHFIAEHATQFPLWLYASVYMAGVAAISMYMAWKLIRGSSTGTKFIAAGAVLVALGSIIQVVFLTASLLGDWDDSTLKLLDEAFYPTFYPGVVLIAVGIAKIHSDHRRRRRRVKMTSTELQKELTKLGLNPTLVPESVEYSREIALENLYSLVITAHDVQSLHGVNVPYATQLKISAAEDVLSRELKESQATASLAGLGQADSRWTWKKMFSRKRK
jgi:hypothetical protein